MKKTMGKLKSHKSQLFILKYAKINDIYADYR